MSLASAFEEVFSKVLPIPKEPRGYRARLPSRANSWIPGGRLGDPRYERRLKEFANEIKAMNISVRPSARGWGYLLEGEGKVTKGQFGMVGKAIGNCIKAGYLPLDIIAEDQDETRRFEKIEEAGDAFETLIDLREKVESFGNDLKHHTTDYLKGEEYFVMMIVEKGDIRGLFESICKEYHVPIASTKGWASNRNKFAIIRLAQKARELKLIPVLLMFYDYDDWGRKISDTTRQKLLECTRGAGSFPDDMIFDRFGLNEDDIQKYHLTYITDPRNGEEKVESNALFRNSETISAAKTMCRNAIEKYLGKNALTRFKKKEESGAQLNEEQINILNDIKEKLDKLGELFPKSELEENTEWKKLPKDERKREKLVTPVKGYFPICPSCSKPFNVSQNDDGKLFICQWCGQHVRLKLPEDW